MWRSASGSDFTYGLYHSTDDTWTEGSITWNNQPTFDGTATITKPTSTITAGVYTEYNHTVTSDLNSDTDGWVSWVAKATSESGTGYRNIEIRTSETGSQPTLYVTYDYAYDVLSYPTMDYNLTGNVTSCYNISTILHNATFEDLESCNETYQVETYEYPDDERVYECLNGTFNYNGTCSDAICYAPEGETQNNCCDDCGCPSSWDNCRSNVCERNSFGQALDSVGEGTGNLLSSITAPTTTILIALGVVAFVLLFVYALATGVGQGVKKGL
jgi:hypothetical protein